MLYNIYQKVLTNCSKVTLLFLLILVIFSLYQSKNFNLDASSMLFQRGIGLKYKEVNQTYGSKDF